jgi:hypothetical protein
MAIKRLKRAFTPILTGQRESPVVRFKAMDFFI